MTVDARYVSVTKGLHRIPSGTLYMCDEDSMMVDARYVSDTNGHCRTLRYGTVDAWYVSDN